MAFLNTVNTALQNYSTDDYMFMGGDFNCTENEAVDRNHTEPHAASQRALRESLKAHGLCDVWRVFNKSVRQYTWAHVRDSFMSLARLDRFYCFKHQLNVFKGCVIVPVGFSDHSLVLCSIFIANLKPKSAYWHFNTSLLCDINFKQVFTVFWNNFRLQKQHFHDLREWWDYGKVVIKQLCQQYTFNVSRHITQSIKELEREILELQGLVDSTGDQSHVRVLKSKTSALNDLLGVGAQGALVRSRFQSLTQMDAPSKFFFSLERRNGQSRFIHSLQSEDGQELTEPTEIRKRAVRFYAALYRSEYKDHEELAAGFFAGLPRVTERSTAELERPLGEQELHAALQGMEGGTAPGIDGLPVEFYKTFWSELGPDLLAVLNESLEDGLLPLSCRRAVITLLPKKGDLQDIRNWRPVSLLCTDLKIFSKALANRLRDVMGQVIHHDQTYCVPGRSIRDNICLLRDILEVSRTLRLDFGLISLDQEKAFDRVEHQYLWQTLMTLGFGPTFISMVRVLYQDIESVLKINGGLSAPFKACRGIRQGCAMSGMLYSLAIEPLLNKLRSKIEGVVLGQEGHHHHQLSAYADDIMVMIKGQADIDELASIVQDFAAISAARVNWAKSDALAVGQWTGGLPALPAGLGWKIGGIKYLGVFLGDETALQKNWDGVVEKMKGRLAKWKWIHGQMSFRGRVLVINNLVASVLWHKLSCVDPPVGLLARLQAILVDFFWDRLHWVPQGVLFLPRAEGGQGLVHLASRLATFRLQFLQKFLTGPADIVWREVACTILRKVDGLGLDTALFLMDYKQLNLGGLPLFYRGLFKIWGLFKTYRLEKTTSLYWLLEEPLIKGARLDVSSSAVPGLTRTLCASGTVTLRNLVDVSGPGLGDVQAVASLLGQKSLRHTKAFIDLWKDKLSMEELSLLQDFGDGSAVPNRGDPFPRTTLSPDLDSVSAL